MFIRTRGIVETALSTTNEYAHAKIPNLRTGRFAPSLFCFHTLVFEAVFYSTLNKRNDRCSMQSLRLDTNL